MELTQNYPVQIVCEILNYPRSSYYYQVAKQVQSPTEEELQETKLKSAIADCAAQWPTYGYRRLTAQLRRAGLLVNSKRVRRLMKEMNLLRNLPKKKKRTTNSNHSFARYPNRVAKLKITCPDQVWVADITYIRLAEEFVYLAVLMDVFTRSIRGWHLSRSLDGDLTLRALKKALAQRIPQIHHSDQGVQYAATDYVKLLNDSRVQISMADVGDPRQNGYAERLMRTIKEEEVNLSDYRNFTEAKEQISQFLEQVYQHKRIHSALAYLTPAEFENQWLNQQGINEEET